MCGIVENADRGTTDYRQTMDSLNRYMAEENVPQRRRVQLRLYFAMCKSMHADKYNMEVCMSPECHRLFGSLAALSH